MPCPITAMRVRVLRAVRRAQPLLPLAAGVAVAVVSIRTAPKAARR